MQEESMSPINHNEKYTSTSLFLYTTSNRVTGLESVTRTTAAGGRRKEFEEELQQGV